MNHRAFWGLVLFAFSLPLLLSCKGDESKIDENFVGAFVDMRLIEQMYGNESPMSRIARKEILKKYGYTRESFIEKSNALMNDASLWVPLQNRVVDRIDSILNPEEFLETKEKELEQKKKNAKQKTKKEEKK